MLQYNNEENGHHSYQTDTSGDDKQYSHIHIEQRNPLENLRINLLDGFRLHIIIDMVMDVVANLIDLVVIAGEHFHTAHQTVVPIVEFAHMTQVHQRKHVVVLRQSGFIDA